MQPINQYTGGDLDRCDARRSDPHWLNAMRQRPTCNILPLWRLKHLVDVTSRPVILQPRQLPDGLLSDTDALFLGIDRAAEPWFAIDIPTPEPPTDQLSTAPDQRWLDLRKFGTLLDHATSALLAQARALAYWNSRHPYCNRCGSAMQMQSGGHQRQCSNTDCGQILYPRIDPAVIMLIHSGEECLLGRQPHWPAGRYSVLAGYVEAGESLEDAVRREVREEVGIGIEQIGYHSSQSWPFPSSLMLGFHARAQQQEINLNDNELEAAAWFSREQLLAQPQDLLLPSRDSIAYRLIMDWLERRIPRHPAP